MAAAPGLLSDEVTCLQAALDTNIAAADQSTFAAHQAQPALSLILEVSANSTRPIQVLPQEPQHQCVP
jgi:hypothetical protein